MVVRDPQGDVLCREQDVERCHGEAAAPVARWVTDGQKRKRLVPVKETRSGARLG